MLHSLHGPSHCLPSAKMDIGERPFKIRKLDQGDSETELSPDHSHDFKQDAYTEEDRKERRLSDDDSRAEGIKDNKYHTEHASEHLTQGIPKPISKNQLKKLKRKAEWEAGREDRKAKRKQKLKEKRERIRKDKSQLADSQAEQIENDQSAPAAILNQTARKKKPKHVRLPVTFLIDCGFDDLMFENEVVSLASQITRCYSANQQAPFRAHMMLSSFGARLRDRFETTLFNQHRSWKGVQFMDDDFVMASEKANERMSGPGGGALAGSFAGGAREGGAEIEEKAETREGGDETQEDGGETREAIHDTRVGEVVYLTSDSPDTLAELKPYSTYIIGGLVDRNRHKGVCYKRAMDKGVRTAKLPIGQYMEMNSRFVLATNHVYEIMAKWLENRDWAEAFMAVMPKRKGGSLKGQKDSEGVKDEAEDVEQQVLSERAMG